MAPQGTSVRVIRNLPATPGWRSFSKSSSAGSLYNQVAEQWANLREACARPQQVGRKAVAEKVGAVVRAITDGPFECLLRHHRDGAAGANPHAPQASAEIADGTLKLTAHAGYKRRLMFRRRDYRPHRLPPILTEDVDRA